MEFKKAERKQSKLRLAMYGVSGSSKTYTLNVPSAGTYTLRYFVETKREKDNEII